MAKLNLSFGLPVQIVHNMKLSNLSGNKLHQGVETYASEPVTATNISIFFDNYFGAVKDKRSDLKD